MPEQELSPADATLARLARLTAMRPGAPLRADDWNALVDAVRALAEQARARALASDGALAAGYAPAEHEHPGVVDLEWFDPSTRALLEGRGGPDSSTGSRPEFTVRDDLQRLDRNVADLRGGLDDVRRDLAGLRELVVQLRDEVIGGGRDLGKLKLRIDALREVEVGVGRIGRDFERLGGRLDEVLTLRERLGEVDPAGLERRLVDLEKLRGQLVGESAVPDLRVLQQDIVRLSDRVSGIGTGGAGGISDDRVRDAEIHKGQGILCGPEAASRGRCRGRAKGLFQEEEEIDDRQGRCGPAGAFQQDV